MVTELLDLARIEARAGKTCTSGRWASAPSLSAPSATCFLPGDKRRVEVQVAPGLPTVFADEDHLVRALTNILSNAYKYSPKGGTIRLDVIERGLDMGPQIGIRVTDQGIGMTAEQLARVETVLPGRPLGQHSWHWLGHVARQRNHELAGEVEIRSEPNQGTEVTLWLRVVTDAYRS